MGGSVSGSVRDVCYTNQIGCTIKHQSNFLLLDVLLNTNQISCCWYVRRFDPDKVAIENSHIYSSVKEEEVFIYWVYLNSFCGLR